MTIEPHLAHMAGHTIDWLINHGEAIDCVEIVRFDGQFEERPHFKAGDLPDENIVSWHLCNFCCGGLGELVASGMERVLKTVVNREGFWLEALLTSEHDAEMFRLMATRGMAEQLADDLFKAERAIRDYLFRVDWERIEQTLMDDGSVKVYLSDVMTVH